MGFKTRRVARSALFLVFASLFWNLLSAQDNRQFKIFQFPAGKIFTIDGFPVDWIIVDKYYYGWPKSGTSP